MGLNSAVALDVFGAIIACITVAMVHIPKQPIEALQQENFFTELRIGYNAIRQNKALFTLLWIGAINMFIYMPINALFPLMSMNYFEGSTLHASVVEIVFAVGMLLGGLLLGAWGGFKKRMANIIGSIFLMGVSLTVSGLLPTNGFMIFAICCTLMGFSAPFYNGVQTALFQEQIQPEYLGRVFRTSWQHHVVCHAAWVGSVGCICRPNRGKPLVFVLRYGYSASRYNSLMSSTT